MEEILASIRRIIADDQALFANRDGFDLDAPRPELDAQAPDIGEAAKGARQEFAPAAADIGRASGASYAVDEEQRALEPDLALWASEDHRLRGGLDPDSKPQAAGLEPSPRSTGWEPEDGSAPAAGGEPASPAVGVEPRLVSAATDASVASAFNALVATRFVQNSDAIAALTRELLRPMLTAWLDAHLPALVERLVRAEIERVARGD
ncbi:PopZ family protein [Methylocapsa aurea]|uniref:PopZ family protein n=1 Tax=Methylocapsa aurea TaxID=663610 RepID=UPI00056D11B0|nr:DUF2497 domain-containing protein [Methylocapsa aurea]